MADRNRVLVSDGASSRPAPRSMARETDTNRQWRSRRNLLIYLAFRQGFSSPFIADAFGLSPSVVLAILKEFSSSRATSDPRRPPERRRRPSSGHVPAP